MNIITKENGDAVFSSVRLKNLFSKMAKGITQLFEPEEVEVTFKRDGGNITYTYVKVDEKKVA